MTCSISNFSMMKNPIIKKGFLKGSSSYVQKSFERQKWTFFTGSVYPTEEEKKEVIRKRERQNLRNWNRFQQSQRLEPKNLPSSKLIAQSRQNPALTSSQLSESQATQLLSQRRSLEEIQINRQIVDIDTKQRDKDLTQYSIYSSGSYLPARIDDEAEVLVDVLSKPFMQFSTANRLAWFRRPILPFYFDRPFFNETQRREKYLKLVEVQKLQDDQLFKLGPDLSAANFILSINCKLKFVGNHEWIEEFHGDNPVPRNEYEPGWFVKAIDVSRSLITYEGFQNLRNLEYLTYLDVSYCEFIDEWGIDRIIGEYKHSLEYLDISGLYKLDWNGIESLWKLSKLKVLVMNDMDHVQDLKLLCLLLLEVNPDLEIRGVDFMDYELLESSSEENRIKLQELKDLTEAPQLKDSYKEEKVEKKQNEI